MQKIFYPRNEQQMQHIAAALALILKPPCCVFLQGELGAGKTTLVRAILRHLGYQQHVKSPTYTLVESYQIGAVHIHHFDLYRIHDAMELELLGIRDYFTEDAILFFEWPENAAELLMEPDIVCDICYLKVGRQVTISGAIDFHGMIANEL
jgi:tRNA threonylcarbamoyladenosine biosynthesis protein TsaE